jgi:putative FmdB family regulatory protein
MPVYEYVCRSCGHHLEVSQSFKDAPLTACPVCGGDLRKLFSSVGVILKGSGFYRTDSRTSTPREPAAAKAGAGKGDGSGAGEGSGKGVGGTESAGTKGDAPSTAPAAASSAASERSAAKPASKPGDVAKSA